MVRNLLLVVLSAVMVSLSAACGPSTSVAPLTNTPAPSQPIPASAQPWTTYANQAVGFSVHHPPGWQVEEEDFEDPETGAVVGKVVRFAPDDAPESEPSPLAGISVWVFPASLGPSYAPAGEEDCAQLITHFVESSAQHLVDGPMGLVIDGYQGAQAVYCQGDPETAPWVAYMTIFGAEDRLFRVNALSNLDTSAPIPEEYAQFVSSLEVLPLTVALVPSPLPSPTSVPPSPTPTLTATPTHIPAPTPTSTVPPIPTDTPPPTPTPRSLTTGTFVTEAVSRDGLGQLSIDNGQELDALAILADPAGSPQIAVYVRSYETFTITGIRDGSYQLFFSLGEDWNQPSAEFTRRASYFRFEDPLPYETIPSATGSRYTAWEVTLHPVVGGTAETEQIGEDEFPALP